MITDHFAYDLPQSIDVNTSAQLQWLVKRSQDGVRPATRTFLTNHYPDCSHQRMWNRKGDNERTITDKDLYSGLIGLHVLHAVEGPVLVSVTAGSRKEKDICGQRSNETESRSGVFTGLRRSATRHWLGQSAKSGSFFITHRR